MSEPFSRNLTLPVFYKRIREFINHRLPLNRQRILSITEGLKMPDIRNLEIGSAKRMTASILFFDIAKFTKTTSELPQEYTLYILNLIIPTVMHIVREFHGKVEKNTGDGIMAIFGTETKEKANIAKDAIEAAIKIRHFMLNDIQKHLYDSGLPILNFRIGIDMDELLIAKIGINTNNFLTAVGNAANRASKLQSLAETNGICIGQYVFHNLHSDLYRYCFEGEDSSWNWKLQGSELPYRYYHFHLDWTEPSTPPTVSRRF